MFYLYIKLVVEYEIAVNFYCQFNLSVILRIKFEFCSSKSFIYRFFCKITFYLVFSTLLLRNADITALMEEVLE